MDAALSPHLTSSAQDREIAATVRRERGRLMAFIRRRVLDAAEAEDVLQEALYELVAAYRLMQPVEQAGAWLMRVARNPDHRPVSKKEARVCWPTRASRCTTTRSSAATLRICCHRRMTGRMPQVIRETHARTDRGGAQ